MTINRVMLKGVSIDVIVAGCPLNFKILMADDLSTGAILGDRTECKQPWIFALC